MASPHSPAPFSSNGASASGSASPATAQWFWLGNGKRNGFESSSNKEVEDAFEHKLASVKFTVHIHQRGRAKRATIQYQITFDRIKGEHVQQNVATGHERRVLRVPGWVMTPPHPTSSHASSKSTAQHHHHPDPHAFAASLKADQETCWYVDTDLGPVQYDADVAEVLERAWLAGKEVYTPFKLRSNSYLLHFARALAPPPPAAAPAAKGEGGGKTFHIQENVKLKTRRNVVRVVGTDPIAFAGGGGGAAAVVRGECEICMVEDVVLVTASAKCKHPPQVCAPCLKDHVRAEVYAKGGDFLVACPMPNSVCRVNLEYHEVQAAAAASVFQHYDKQLVRDVIYHCLTDVHPPSDLYPHLLLFKV